MLQLALHGVLPEVEQKRFVGPCYQLIKLLLKFFHYLVVLTMLCIQEYNVVE